MKWRKAWPETFEAVVVHVETINLEVYLPSLLCTYQTWYQSHQIWGMVSARMEVRMDELEQNHRNLAKKSSSHRCLNERVIEKLTNSKARTGARFNSIDDNLYEIW